MLNLSRWTFYFFGLMLILASPEVIGAESPEVDAYPSEVQEHLKKGFRHLKKDRYVKAIEELELARGLSDDPCMRCLRGIALSYYRAEKFEDAVKAYEELFEMEPHVLSLLGRLVRLYDRLDTPEKAIDAYETFLENSDNPDEMVTIYNELGVRRLTPGVAEGTHRGDAASAFRGALELAMGRSNLLRRNLAEALWQLGSKDEALAVLDTLVEEDEESWNWLPAVERNPELVKKEWHVRSTWRHSAVRRQSRRPSGRCDRRGAGTASLGEPLLVGGDIRAPDKEFSPQPQYTEITRKGRVQGTVTIRATIDEQGCVRDTQIMKSLHPELDEEARKAIQKWEFAPPTRQGKPIAVYYDLTVNFRLQ